MTKRLLAMLLVLAMVLSLLPATVIAVELGAHDNAHVCPDANCSAATIEWKPWTGTEKNGHYYLTDDIKLPAQVELSNTSLHLCLNGHTIDGQGKIRLFYVHNNAKLTISDCTTELQDGKFVSGGSLIGGTNGATAGAVYAKKDSKASTTETVQVTLIGVALKNNTSSAAEGTGGYSGGALQIRDGAQLEVKSCLFESNSAREGGAIAMRNGATATITDSEFKNNTAEVGGGAIYVGGSTANLERVNIENNACTNTGGSAVHTGSTATLTIKDSTVTGNKNTKSGAKWTGAVYQDSANDKIILSGKVIVDNNTADQGKAERNLVLVRNGSSVFVSGLADGSNVHVWLANYVSGVTAYTDASLLVKPAAGTEMPTVWDPAWVTYDENGHSVILSGGKFAFLDMASAHYHCLCGNVDTAHTHANAVWTAWGDDAEEKNKLPTASGSYYLTQDVVLTAAPAQMTNSVDICICLNGFNIKGKGDHRIFSLAKNANLTVTNCQPITEEKGNIQNGNFASNGGGAIYTGSDAAGKISLYGVALRNNTSGQTTSDWSGGAIFLRNSVSLKAVGCVFEGNAAQDGGAALIRQKAQAEFVNCTFKNNEATANGGAIRVSSGNSAFDAYPELTLTGCTFEDNRATGGEGGAVSVSMLDAQKHGSVVTISDTTFQNNTATNGNGGAVCITNNDTKGASVPQVTITGGSMTGNKSIASELNAGNNAVGGTGGAIYSRNAVLTIDGTAIKNNSAETTVSAGGTGGALAVATSSKVSLKNVDIQENTAPNGGAVCIMSNAELTLSSGNISKNTTPGDGGAFYVAANGNLILAGGSITENTAAKKGGGLYVTGTSKVLKLTGTVVVQNNIAAEARSNLQLGGNKTMTVENLAAGTKVGISTDKAEIYISEQTDDVADCFTADNNTYKVIHKDGKLFMDYSTDHRHCLCGDGTDPNCDHKNIPWTAWGDDESEKGKLPTNSGNYYLVADVTLTENANVSSNDDIKLCLNGKTVKVDYKETGVDQDQVYYMTRNGKLTISDCTAVTTEGKYVAGKLTGGTKGVLSMNTINGNKNENTLVIYDGILTGNSNTSNGGAINMKEGSGKLFVYGGEISGNQVPKEGGAIYAGAGNTVTIAGGIFRDNTAGNSGGAVHAMKASLLISGGQFTGNRAKQGAALYITNSNANISGGVFHKNTAETTGGVASISTDSMVEISGGQFTENTAPDGGALCIMSRSHVTVSGGTFAQNKVVNDGGAVYISHTGKLTVTGGEMTKNQAGRSGGAIYQAGKNNSTGALGGQLTLAGGRITDNVAGANGGGISVNATAQQLHLTGAPVVSGNKVGKTVNNLQLLGEKTVTVGTMEKAAQVGITASGLPRYITEKVTGDPTGAFVPDSVYRVVSLKNEKVLMDYTGEHQHCLCGDGKDANCSHGNVGWAAWEASDALPTESGSYYLLSDVVLSSAATLRTGADVKLCLNGHTITANHDAELKEEDRVYILRNDSKLTLSDCTAATDSKGNYTAGKLTGGSMGAVILHGNCSATFNMYDGIITGNNRADNVGGGVVVRETKDQNVFNMYGGEISNNWAKGNGGAMYVKENAVFNMYGGTIKNNKSTGFHGGAIAVVKDGTMNMYGGTISRNEASKNGGGIFVQEGVLNLKGGTITGNTGNNGGGVSAITAKVNVTGTKIDRNTGRTAGGAISASTKSNIKISGGSLNSNKAKDAGGIVIMSNSVLTMNGGSVGYNVSQANGGGVYISRTGKFTLSGGSIHHNTCPKSGAGVLLTQATFNMYGGDISYNKADTTSGGILIGGQSQANMYGGNIRGNESIRGAGAVVQGKATLNMHGGKFQGNIAEIEAGALYVSPNSFYNLLGGEVCENVAAYRCGGILANASFTIAGGEIHHNKVTGSEEYPNPYAGGVAIIGETEKTLTMTGGSIHDNYSAGTGGGMRINYMNTLQMSGGTFQNNTAEKTAGGLEIYGHANITGGEFLENHAGTVGGGLRVVSRVQLNMENVLFKGNTAATRGGGVYLAKGNWTQMKNCTFTENESKEQGSAIYSWDELLLDGCTITGNTAGSEGAVYLCSANFDGQSYVLSVPKLAGNLVIKDNNGPCPGLYFEDGAVATIAAQGLGKDANVQIFLQAGVLTNTLLGTYNYEGGEGVYTVTYGDRSDKEFEAFEIPGGEAQDSDPQASSLNWLLYTGIGVLALAVIAVLVVLLLRRKKQPAVKE